MKKYFKFLIPLVFAFSLFLTSCADKTKDSENKGTESTDVLDGEKTEELNNVTFSIPDTWKKFEEASTENIYYYAPIDSDTSSYFSNIVVEINPSGVPAPPKEELDQGFSESLIESSKKNYTDSTNYTAKDFAVPVGHVYNYGFDWVVEENVICHQEQYFLVADNYYVIFTVSAFDDKRLNEDGTTKPEPTVKMDELTKLAERMLETLVLGDYSIIEAQQNEVITKIRAEFPADREITGNTMTSNKINMKVTLPDTWRILEDKELFAAMGEFGVKATLLAATAPDNERMQISIDNKQEGLTFDDYTKYAKESVSGTQFLTEVSEEFFIDTLAGKEFKVLEAKYDFAERGKFVQYYYFSEEEDFYLSVSIMLKETEGLNYKEQIKTYFEAV